MGYLRMAMAGGAVVLLIITYWLGHQAGSESVQVEWDRDKLARTHLLLKREQEHRALERKWQEAVQHVGNELTERERSTRDDLETTISDLNAGTLVLRERFRGCRAELSQAASAASSDHGGDGRGLSAADQEFLVRVGANCDAAVHRLTGAQDYIRGIQ